MNMHVKKLAVLEQLRLSTELLTLEQLLKNLGLDFAERSVRRWLAELIEEGLVEKIGNKKSSKYKIIQKIDVPKNNPEKCFSSESEKTIARVRRPLYERAPTSYNDDWVNSYEPNLTFYIPQKMRAQLRKVGERSKREDPAGTYAHQIFNRLLIDLSYNSSRLEGNTYSLLDTQKLVLEGLGVEGKLDEEKIMILNHKEAIRYLVDNAVRISVNYQVICTLHYLLSDALLEAPYAGKVRDHIVRIGGSTYLPFEDPKQLQLRLDKLIEKASLIKDPYEQSIFLLIHISYLQAFADVNKRTARLSANIPLIKNNLVPLSFNDVDREDYISSMIAIYELQDTGPLLDLYLFSYSRTCEMYDSTVKAMGFDEIRVRYRQQRRELLGQIISKKLTGKRLQEFIQRETSHKVLEKDRGSFIEDVFEDLKEMGPSRIAGLGITQSQLNEWLSAQ